MTTQSHARRAVGALLTAIGATAMLTTSADLSASPQATAAAAQPRTLPVRPRAALHPGGRPSGALADVGPGEAHGTQHRPDGVREGARGGRDPRRRGPPAEPVSRRPDRGDAEPGREPLAGRLHVVRLHPGRRVRTRRHQRRAGKAGRGCDAKGTALCGAAAKRREHDVLSRSTTTATRTSTVRCRSRRTRRRRRPHARQLTGRQAVGTPWTPAG